jgi:methionyl aminopeptidase
MTIKTGKDLRKLKQIGKIVALIRDEMLRNARAGITTAELDRIGKRLLSWYGAMSAPKSVYNFPGFTCISLNEEAAHGIPGKRVICAGDLVNIDVSAERDGYFADTGATILVGTTNCKLKAELCRCSLAALYQGIAAARNGNCLNQIGKAIYREARRNGFQTIKNLCGHGIGRSLHEEPYKIENYYEPSNKQKLHAGQVLAVETFISTGAKFVVKQKDGWTLKTQKHNFVAQFEHTIVVTEDMPMILTDGYNW